ncbi:MAG: hypothetical protein RL077_5575, partial [Verrucomicrobiota bacterium]
MSQTVIFTHDCPVTAIPSGEVFTVVRGTEAFIVQTLGGNITVRTDQGLFRVAEENVAALGGVVLAEPTVSVAGTEFSEEAVWSALKTCFDPEIPVNIVDLGLIYDLAIDPGVSGGHAVEVK